MKGDPDFKIMSQENLIRFFQEELQQIAESGVSPHKLGLGKGECERLQRDGIIEKTRNTHCHPPWNWHVKPRALRYLEGLQPSARA